ncbi:AMP-binding protein [Companilactobacillus halodurans]|uniref:AMP-binding protein n=1 Tax=Companilactobacillus halodurans TaxID=2584183 RepID=A0A5P0ZP49_9LACO|nr:AMP-binding protein [Companilactobacillus halodurans]MQS75972.1 AMP-binding protein [Companilactobacillus halodurans]MQS96407.1 AMP-binding protein [Companilactobacillus halodurans]
MSELTERLNQQLLAGASRPLMQDAKAHWYSGNELNLEKNVWKNYWKNKGIGHNDIVLIALTNSVSYTLVTQSLWEIGAIVQPINPKTTEIQISELENQYHYSAIVVNSDVSQMKFLEPTFSSQPRLTTLHEPEVQIYVRNKHVAHLIDDPDDDQIGLIMHTSGTTGKPKRVGLTHRQLLAGAFNVIDSEELTEKDSTFILMPMFHINAMVISNLATRLSHGQLLFRPKFSAHLFWKEVGDEMVTWVSLTPAIVAILLQREEKPAENNLRFLRTASAPLLPSIHKKFHERFNIPLIESYGMTEAAGQIAQNPLEKPIQNTVGTIHKIEIKILDKDLKELPIGSVGEIALKGDNIITHYLDPQPEAFDNGFLLTGDLGSLDINGYLTIAGRSKEMIIRGGENVNPLAVENCLVNLKFVKEVAVVGTPDLIYGETVTAVIVPKEQTKEHQHQLALLNELANEQLLPVERPTKYIFDMKLPKNATGKIQRTLLAQEVTQQLKEA